MRRAATGARPGTGAGLRRDHPSSSAAPAARIGTVEYTNIIWATLIGIFIFQEWPHWTVYAGAALIIAGSFMLLKAKKS